MSKQQAVSVLAPTYQNPSMPLYLALENGQRVNVAHCTANLRGNQGISIHIDVADPALCAANRAALTPAVMGFIGGVLDQAEANGVPVKGIAGE
ncbi:MAG: hypothetical protein GXY67_10600 [Clostridiales bacterium]|nr:hypothetical protein [Clostridiales bacterium]